MNNQELDLIIFSYESQGSIPLVAEEQLSEDDLDTMWNGYAATINAPTDNNFYWLAFKIVEDHVDGNGITTLYIKQGSGLFYYGEQVIEVKENDVILFDDNIEHGFSSENLCIALNMTWDYIPTKETVQHKIEEAIYNYKLEIKEPKKVMKMF